MVTYYVKQNEVYTIAATDECIVYNASGTQVVTCPANSSINVKAATGMLKLSDDNAVLKKAVSESGGVTEEVTAHLDNSDIHVTSAEKLNYSNHIANSAVHMTSAEKEKLRSVAVQGQTVSFPTIHVNDVVGNSIMASSSISKSNSETLGNESVLNKSELDANYTPKNLGTANAILITDGNGNIAASTVISVSELNTLNNNVNNIATKLSSIESRIAALES